MKNRIDINFASEELKQLVSDDVKRIFNSFDTEVYFGDDEVGQNEKDIFVVKTEKERDELMKMGGACGGAGLLEETWSELFGLGKYLFSVIVNDPIPFLLHGIKWELFRKAVIKSLSVIKEKKADNNRKELVLVFNSTYFSIDCIDTLYIIPIDTSEEELNDALKQIPKINKQLKSLFKKSNLGTSFLKFEYNFLKKCWYVKN